MLHGQPFGSWCVSVSILPVMRSGEGGGGGGGLGSPLYVSAKQNVRGCVFVVAVCLVPHVFFSMADEA